MSRHDPFHPSTELADGLELAPRRATPRLAGGACLGALAIALFACGGDAADAQPDADITGDVIAFDIACDDTIETLYALPEGLPAYDATHRGDIVRCALDRAAGAAVIDAQVRELGYEGPTLPSGATVYRIAYRTERAPASDGSTREAISSALLLVPSVPRGSGATVVYAHPAVGIAAPCAPSRYDVLAPPTGWQPALAPLLALVGAGYTVIAPDYAGYGYGQPPGFAYADDVARSVLDATRAVTKAVPAAYRGTQFALVGHSQGGHAVLSAHALAGSYGHDGELVGVVGLAPLWITPYAWGAIISNFAGFDTTNHAYLIEYAMAYLYSRAELTDGAGAGAALFMPEKQAAAESLLLEQCLNEFATMLPTLGAHPYDFFDPTVSTSLGDCGVSGGSVCNYEPAATWVPRWNVDRPHLSPGGPPILTWFSGRDTTITPGFAQCELDRLSVDVGDAPGALTACKDPGSTHDQVQMTNIAWVTQWIAARAFGDAEPVACAPMLADDGGPLTCTTPPPNL